MYRATVFSRQDEELDESLKSCLCLPVAADEILAAGQCQFFVVDCRGVMRGTEGSARIVAA